MKITSRFPNGRVARRKGINCSVVVPDFPACWHLYFRNLAVRVVVESQPPTIRQDQLGKHVLIVDLLRVKAVGVIEQSNNATPAVTVTQGIVVSGDDPQRSCEVGAVMLVHRTALHLVITALAVIAR